MSQPQIPHLPIPSRVGNYQLLKTIGKGQFGYVKLAIHDLTRERVAIKVIQKNRLDEKTLRMVSREISIMKLLSHPNVIRLYEVIDSEIFLFLVMEYAAGGEIMDFIVTHGKLKERDARRIFRQVVEAIDYCHEVHVIHRDLKAENLLLDSQLGIKLIDFGLSNRWAPGELLKTFCGSPTYTAPELIKRQQYEGPEVDLWSLGVLLYVLVCGSLPFDGNTFQELFTKIINGQYSVPDHVSPECRDLIGRMLVVNPKQRATLDQVREHTWTREGGKPVPKASVGKMTVPLSESDMDQDVLEELVNIGFEREYAVQAVLSNSYDDAAATYCLLVEAKKRRVPIAAAQTGAYAQAGQTSAAQRPAFDAPMPPNARNTSGQGTPSQPQHAIPMHIPQIPAQRAPPPPSSPSVVPPQVHLPNQSPLTHSSGASRAKSASPSGAQQGVTFSNEVMATAYGAESGNPAYRGQAPKRRERTDGKAHRRHHTVGTPGEFPLEEEEQLAGVPSSHHAHHNGSTATATGSNMAEAPVPLHASTSNAPRSGSTTFSPTTSRTRSPRRGGNAINSNKNGVEDDDMASTIAETGEHVSTLSLSGGSNGSSSNTASTNTFGSTTASSTSSTSSGRRGKHMRMLSNPPPIDEEEEMFYPPQAIVSHAISSSSSPMTYQQGTVSASASPAISSAHNNSSASNRAARPTGGLQPRSATMRTEKTRHKDHSRPVTSKKKGHLRRTSFDPDEPSETTPLASSQKELKRASDKKLNISNGSPLSPTVASAAASSSAAAANMNITIPTSPRNNRKAGKVVPSSSPPLSDEDAQMVSLMPSTPPLSPTTPARGPIGLETTDNLKSSSGSVGSAPSTPLKPVVVKKESRSIVTRFKGLFSRKGPEPRQVRFSINENNTTHQAPELVLTRIVEVLKALDLPHGHFVSPFCIKTETDTGVLLEVEICQLPIIHLIGVRFRRISGDAWQYTRVCKRILDLLDLNNSASKHSSLPGLSTSASSSSNSNLTGATSNANGTSTASTNGGSSLVGASSSSVNLGSKSPPITSPTITLSPSPTLSPANPLNGSAMPVAYGSSEGSKESKKKRLSGGSRKKHAVLLDDTDNTATSTAVIANPTPSKRTSTDSDSPNCSTPNTASSSSSGRASKALDEPSSTKKHKASKMHALQPAHLEDYDSASSSGSLA